MTQLTYHEVDSLRSKGKTFQEIADIQNQKNESNKIHWKSLDTEIATKLLFYNGLSARLQAYGQAQRALPPQDMNPNFLQYATVFETLVAVRNGSPSKFDTDPKSQIHQQFLKAKNESIITEDDWKELLSLCYTGKVWDAKSVEQVINDEHFPQKSNEFAERIRIGQQKAQDKLKSGGTVDEAVQILKDNIQ